MGTRENSAFPKVMPAGVTVGSDFFATNPPLPNIVFLAPAPSGGDDTTILNSWLVTAAGATAMFRALAYSVTTGPLVGFSNTVISAYGATIALSTSAGRLFKNNALLGGGARDTNIKILGGTWKRDATVADQHLVVFHRCDGAEVIDATFNTLHGKYALYFADVTRYRARNLNLASTYSDGVHVTGPASNGFIEMITGTSGDDAIALSGRDYSQYELTVGGGDIKYLEIRNIDANSTNKTAVHLLAGNAVKLRDILVDGVRGVCGGHGVSVTDDTLQANTTGEDADSIILRNITPQVASGFSLVAIGGIGVGSVTIDGLGFDLQTSAASINGVLLGATLTAKSVSVRDVKCLNATNGPTLVNYAAGAAVGLLVIDGVEATFTAGQGGRVLQLDGTPTRLKISDVEQLEGSNFVNATTTSPVIGELSDIQIKGGFANAYLIAGNAAHTIEATNISVDGLGNGFFVLTSGSLDANVKNFRKISGAGLVFRSASQTVRIAGDTSCSVDVSILTPQLGDIINNSNAAVTPFTTGLCVWDGTIWRPLKGFMTSGTAILAAGTIAVADTKVTANSVIRAFNRTPGGTRGALWTENNAGVGFSIKSTNAADTSTCYYEVEAY